MMPNGMPGTVQVRPSLTPEAAQVIPLPLNPMSRHLAVKKILRSEAFIGDVAKISHKLFAGYVAAQAFQPTIHFVRSMTFTYGESAGTVYSNHIFLGRKALEQVADGLTQIPV